MDNVVPPATMAVHLFDLPNEILIRIYCKLTMNDILDHIRLYPRIRPLLSSQYFWQAYIRSHIGFLLTPSLRKAMMDKNKYLMSGLGHCRRWRKLPVTMGPTNRIKLDVANRSQPEYTEWYNNWSVLIMLPGLGIPFTVLDEMRPRLKVVFNVSVKTRSKEEPVRYDASPNFSGEDENKWAFVCVQLMRAYPELPIDVVYTRSTLVEMKIQPNGSASFKTHFEIEDYPRGVRYIHISTGTRSPLVVKHSASIIFGDE